MPSSLRQLAAASSERVVMLSVDIALRLEHYDSPTRYVFPFMENWISSYVYGRFAVAEKLHRIIMLHSHVRKQPLQPL